MITSKEQWTQTILEGEKALDQLISGTKNPLAPCNTPVADLIDNKKWLQLESLVESILSDYND